jgi:hypothetical protein
MVGSVASSIVSTAGARSFGEAPLSATLSCRRVGAPVRLPGRVAREVAAGPKTTYGLWAGLLGALTTVARACDLWVRGETACSNRN